MRQPAFQPFERIFGFGEIGALITVRGGDWIDGREQIAESQEKERWAGQGHWLPERGPGAERGLDE